MTTFFDIAALANIVTALMAFCGVVAAFIAIWVANQANRSAKRIATRDVTERVYEKWWGKPGVEDIRELRKYFYTEFLEKYLPIAQAKAVGLKDIEVVIPEDQGRARKLCYFFDQVGWLGAAGLLDVDYVLGPMQHVMRRVWFVMKPFIMRQRRKEVDKPNQFDPAYQRGFEWLFMYSERNHQAKLFLNKFSRPSILSRESFRSLMQEIDENELDFCKLYISKGSTQQVQNMQ
jgi:hypothetical protein